MKNKIAVLIFGLMSIHLLAFANTGNSDENVKISARTQGGLGSSALFSQNGSMNIGHGSIDLFGQIGYAVPIKLYSSNLLKMSAPFMDAYFSVDFGIAGKRKKSLLLVSGTQIELNSSPFLLEVGAGLGVAQLDLGVSGRAMGGSALVYVRPHYRVNKDYTVFVRPHVSTDFFQMMTPSSQNINVGAAIGVSYVY